jgi:hypothetical protein
MFLNRAILSCNESLSFQALAQNVSVTGYDMHFSYNSSSERSTSFDLIHVRGVRF